MGLAILSCKSTALLLEEQVAISPLEASFLTSSTEHYNKADEEIC